MLSFGSLFRNADIKVVRMDDAGSVLLGPSLYDEHVFSSDRFANVDPSFLKAKTFAHKYIHPSDCK